MTTDQELLNEFVKVTEYPDVIVIFVGEITWSGHVPDLNWVPLIALPIGTPASKVQKQAEAVLQRRRYFAVCESCSNRNPLGWMTDLVTCQSCSERLGVVF